MNASCRLNPNKGIWAGHQALSWGFVHKCDRMQSLQCLHWQVFQSAGDVSNSAFIHTAPTFVPYFVSVALSRTVPKYKSERMQSVFCNVLFASFLSTECCAVGQHVGDFIVGKTKQYYNFWWRLPTPPSFSLHFSDPPLYPSPSFTLTLPLTVVFLSHFSFLCYPVGFLQRLIQTETRRKIIIRISNNLKFYFWCFSKVAPGLDAAAKLFCAWLRKNIFKHMVFQCSFNWVNWRPMGIHRGG